MGDYTYGTAVPKPRAKYAGVNVLISTNNGSNGLHDPKILHFDGSQVKIV